MSTQLPKEPVTKPRGTVSCLNARIRRHERSAPPSRYSRFSDARTCASRRKRALRSAFVMREVGRNLERDVVTELGVLRAVDLTHTAGAERRKDVVPAGVLR